MTFQPPSNSIRPLPTPLLTWVPTAFQSLPTAFQPRASNPPYPPALEAPNAARVAARRSRRFEGKGRKAAACRHVRRNAAHGRVPARIIPGLGRDVTGYDPSFAARVRPHVLPPCFPLPRRALRSDCKRLIALLIPYHRPICPNHVASSGKGFSRAGANSVFHSVEADQVRARARWRGEMARPAAEKTRRGWGWGEITGPFYISTYPPNFAPLSENLRPQRRLCAPVRAHG